MNEQGPDLVPPAQEPGSTPSMPAAPAAPAAASPTPRLSRRNLWIWAGAVLALVCLCSMGCLALTATGIGKVLIERGPVEAVLDKFMRAMVARDTQSAYALFSPRAQRQVPISELEKMIAGRNYALFDGYQAVRVDQLQLTAAANLDPNAPQGTIAEVTGTVQYDGGITGTFTGTLEKVNGLWMLDRIFVNVPVDKIQP